MRVLPVVPMVPMTAGLPRSGWRLSGPVILVRMRFGNGCGGPPWHRHDDGYAFFQAMELESEIGAELMLQPRPGGGHADPLLQRRQRILRHPQPSSRTSIRELVPVAPGGDVD